MPAAWGRFKAAAGLAMSNQSERRARPRREPAFNAPWTILALIAALVAAHGWREWSGVGVDRFALTGEDLDRGRWSPLISYLFVHASWAHVLMNAASVLAFGVPVARLFNAGSARRRLLRFLRGLRGIAALGYEALPATPGMPWRGESDAGAGGGVRRGVRPGRGGGPHSRRARVAGPLPDRTVLGMTAAWIVVNVAPSASRASRRAPPACRWPGRRTSSATWPASSLWRAPSPGSPERRPGRATITDLAP